MLTNSIVAIQRLRNLRTEIEETPDGMDVISLFLFHDILNALDFTEGQQQAVLGAFQFYVLSQPIDSEI